MAYGLSFAPSVFQNLINDVFWDLLGKYIIAYIHNILIYSPDQESHVRHVQEVLSRLLCNHLFVELEKCEFHLLVISFLGYIIGTAGASMDPGKVKAITTWPTPSTMKELQCFL